SGVWERSPRRVRGALPLPSTAPQGSQRPSSNPLLCGFRGSKSASGQALGDLLEHPGVAIGIAEPGAREVAATLGVRAAHDLAVLEMTHLADVGAPLDQLVPGLHDVVDDEEHPL